MMRIGDWRLAICDFRRTIVNRQSTIQGGSMDELLAWRKEFPILENTVYMISHSLGAMPGRPRDRLQEYADMWATRGIRAWDEGWWMMPTKVGDMIAKIVGAEAGEVVMHPNVSI